jgi:hypothetical protein
LQASCRLVHLKNTAITFTNARFCPEKQYPFRAEMSEIRHCKCVRFKSAQARSCRTDFPVRPLFWAWRRLDARFVRLRAQRVALKRTIASVDSRFTAVDCYYSRVTALANPPSSATASPPSRSTSASAIVSYLAGAKLLFHLLIAGRYGIFRDELYYLACSEHLAWGYVDQPPLIALVAWFTKHVFGSSLLALRRRWQRLPLSPFLFFSCFITG